MTTQGLLSPARRAAPALPRAALLLPLALALGGCGGDDAEILNTKPAFLGTVNVQEYDGASDDLLTAGLGKTGLAGALPAFADAANPTAAELRRAAIYNNYRALVDMTAAGGYGTLYGPNVDKDGQVTAGEGKIAGAEYLAYSDDGSGRQNVTMMVQVPAGFDARNPCIQTATSSGSRGVYGAMSTGEWGLKHGCAVAYTDKGTGGDAYDMMNDTVPLIDGTRGPSSVGALAHFRPVLTEAERTAFNAATPNRFAFKHAHSQRNPEKDWGQFTLQAVEFALWAINERYGERNAAGQARRTFTPEKVLVIASSVSNGGGAAIAAAEQDSEGLIDGVAVGEPMLNLPATAGVTVKQGAKTFAVSGKPLYDYTTMANLLQPCAAISTQVAGTPGAGFIVPAFAANRCAALHTASILAGLTTADQADEALQKLQDYGWLPESNVIHPSLAAFEVASAVSVTFANALARASVLDNLCGYSFAATTGAGVVTTLPAASLAGMFATGNGVPPSSGVQLVNNNHPTGPLRDILSTSPSTGLPDYNADGARCLRDLLTGTSTAAQALQTGLAETLRSGNLHGKPALIVHGRSDALLPVNHTSRPYLGFNRLAEGSASRLSYIEVTNAQHFDSFIGLPTILPGYDTRFVPLHVYLNRALDAVYAHLKSGAALPPSQVVRTVPRGGTPGAAPAITAANVPAFATVPAAGDTITVSSGTVTVPD